MMDNQNTYIYQKSSFFASHVVPISPQDLLFAQHIQFHCPLPIYIFTALAFWPLQSPIYIFSLFVNLPTMFSFPAWYEV